MKNKFLKLLPLCLIILFSFSLMFIFSNKAVADTGCFGDFNGDGGWDQGTLSDCQSCVNDSGTGGTWCYPTSSCVSGSFECPGTTTQYTDGCSATDTGVPACSCSAAYSSCTSGGNCSGTSGCLEGGGGDTGECGDGFCSGAIGEDYNNCSLDCIDSGGGGGGSCGNFAIDTGEQCDQGPGNGPSPAICSSTCQLNSTLFCNIDSFDPVNGNPTSGTGTSLVFSLSGNYPWTITEINGANYPFPGSSTSTDGSGSSDTGNLTGPQTYIYRLSCNGGQDTADTTVIVGNPNIYMDDSTAVFTTPIPATLAPGQVVNFTVRVTNTGSTEWYHGDAYRFEQQSGHNIISTAPPNVTGLNYGALPNVVWSPEFVDWSFNLTAPSTPGPYTFLMKMVHKAGWNYYDGSWGPGGPSSDVLFGQTASASFNVATTSGTISASNCSISLNGINCPSNINWNTTNPIGTSTVVVPPSTTIATANSGSTTYTVTGNGLTFSLKNNNSVIAQATSSPTCTSGVWNGSICAPVDGGWSASGAF